MIWPDNPRALHLLGLIAHQVGRHAEAAALISRAIRHDGSNANYYSDLGAALKQQGRFEESIAALRQAIRMRPDLAKAHCNLGATLRHRGELAEAVAACREAIRIRPDLAEAYSNLGVLLHEQGKLDEAVAAFSHAVRIEPHSAESRLNLGQALRALGRRDEAVEAYRQAVQLRPTWAEAHSCLGALLCENGCLDEAVAACRHAIRIRPDFAEAYFNLGLALCAQGKLDEAALAQREAIRLKPDFAEAHSGLGSVLRAQGRLDEAVAAHRAAIGLKPDFADAYANLGRALHDQDMTAAAVDALQQAIRLDPSLAEAHHSLGLALRVLGRLPESRAALEEAVRLAPRDARCLRSLSEIARFAPGDARLAAIEELCRGAASLPVDDRIELHFALGKAYDDLGRPAEAFRHWSEGNALKRRQISYEEAALLGAVDRVRTVFTRELIEARQNRGEPSSVPVFIVGMMRSGTTLVEQILASHPRAFAGGEMKHLTAAARAVCGKFGSAASFPDIVPDMADADFRDIGAGYISAISNLAPEATCITDKMPGNFIFAGLIHLALPNAVIIHTSRDPVDTCLSCFSKLFAGEPNHAYDLGELGRYYRHYQALMAHWHAVLPPGRILDVRYEELVADLEGQARRIVAHCGLDWDPRCLAFHETERSVRTASATQVRQPIYSSSVGRSRMYAPFLGPLLAELGIPAV